MHDFRLGAEAGKINVLGGKPKWGHTLSIVLLGGLLAGAHPVSPAGEADGQDAPLEWCWGRVSARVELAECLRGLLRDAEDRLAARQAQAERDAAELDRVTGHRNDNLGLARESDTRFRAYRDAECERRSVAMSPGTGTGDVLLACHVELTNARLRHLGNP